MPPTVALLPVTCRRYAASAGARVCRKMNHVIRDGTEVDVVVSACVTWHTLDGTLVRRPVSRTCVRPDGRSQAGEEDDHDDNRDIRMPLCHNPDPSRRFSSFRRHLSTCVRVPRGAARRGARTCCRARHGAREENFARLHGFNIRYSYSSSYNNQDNPLSISMYRHETSASLSHTHPPRGDSPPPPSPPLSHWRSFVFEYTFVSVYLCICVSVYLCIWDVCGGRTDEGCRARRVKRCNPGAVQCARGGQAGGTLMVG